MSVYARTRPVFAQKSQAAVCYDRSLDLCRQPGCSPKSFGPFSTGDRSKAEAILREVLPKVHQIAARHLQKERSPAPISPTELIREVWLRHLQQGGWRIQNRERFYAIAGCATRRLLVDYARNRLALKRGGEDAFSR
jgi:hypothetical protein